MQIGRKIYYDLSTGNVLLDKGEMQGSVIETTLEQDCASYVALSERVPSTVGLIQLAYGQYADKFGYYNYSVVEGAIVWGELIDIDVTPPIIQPTNIEISEMQMTILSGIADVYMATLGF